MSEEAKKPAKAKEQGKVNSVLAWCLIGLEVIAIAVIVIIVATTLAAL